MSDDTSVHVRVSWSECWRLRMTTDQAILTSGKVTIDSALDKDEEQ